MRYLLLANNLLFTETVFFSLCAVPQGALSAQEAPARGAPAQAVPAQGKAVRRVVRSYREQHERSIVDEFVELLSIPNVSRDRANIERNAAWIQRALDKRGVSTQLLRVRGSAPVVFGEIRPDGAARGGSGRTIVLYAHYDGQPVDASEWTGQPFEPSLYDTSIAGGGKPIPLPGAGERFDPESRLYARSAGDDKAPIVSILAALDALRAAKIKPRSHIKFFFEGEEEMGSINLRRILRRHRALLGADIWIFCDGPVHQNRQQQVVFGVRGITGFDVTVYGARRPLHSGHYGNWAPNPAMMLAQLLSSMKDDAGKVLVDGYYDDVAPLTGPERRALAAAPQFDAELKKELWLKRTEGGGRRLDEMINLPSLNVRGLRSATVGRLGRNIVPATATASVDLRLVKGMDPKRAVARVVAHIRSRGYHVVETEPDEEVRRKHGKVAWVLRRSGYAALRTPMDLPIAQSVVRAVEAVRGPVVRLPTLGGSLPLSMFGDELKVPVVIVPIANHDNNQHAPNENLRIQNLWDGIETMAALLTMPQSSSPLPASRSAAPILPSSRSAALKSAALRSATQNGGEATPASVRKQSFQQHQRMARESVFKDLQWRAVGPRLQGGRIEAIAVHPEKPSTIYVGPGSGNLWKTSNNGLSWKPIFENESTFTVGDVAISQSDPEIVWVGTGETQPRHSGYSFAGTGVFKSLDGGETWRNMGLWETHHIGKVVIDPKNPDVVYVAAIGHFWSSNPERGVFKTRDGGETWKKVLFVSDRTGVVDLAMDPMNSSTLFAAAWQVTEGEESGLYKSTDAGETWKRLAAGLPVGATGRAGIEVARSNPSIVYAFIDNHAPFQRPKEQRPVGQRRGGRHRNRRIAGGEVYRSDDKGEHWRRVNQDDLYDVFTVYGWKFCDVRVSPQNPEEIFILGNRVFHSKDGGKTFVRIGEKILRMHDTEGKVMHLDHHDLWIDPRDSDRLILGNDGGLFMSHDRGRTWLHVNNLPIGEFYFVSYDMAKPFRIYGGTQDNASLFGPSTAQLEPFANDPWRHVFLDQWTGGDGFVTLKDPTADNIVYYEHQHGAMRRMDITGPVLTGRAKGIRPRARRGEPQWRFGWYAPFVISHHDPRTLYAGANRVLKSSDRGDHWEAISPDISNLGRGERAVVPFGTITMISESPMRRGLLYAGTEGGALHVTRDEGKTWKKVGDGLPRKWVSRVIASQHEEGRVYVSMTGFRQDDFKSYVFVSVDFGATFRSIAAGLPAESINVIREDPTSENVLYVGTDLGVYASTDRGKVWHSLRANLPTTPVHDLVVHPRDRQIVIGTHGRSVFVLDAKPIQDFKE